MSRLGEHRIDIFAEKVQQGQIAPASFWEDITSLSITSAQATAELGPFPSAFKRIRVWLDNVRPVNNDVGLFARLSNDGGLTFLTSSDYRYAARGHDSSAQLQTEVSGSAVRWALSEFTQINFGVGNDAGLGEGAMGIISLSNPLVATELTRYRGEIQYTSASNTEWLFSVQGRHDVKETHDAIQFFFETGDIAVGEFLLQGART